MRQGVIQYLLRGAVFASIAGAATFGSMSGAEAHHYRHHYRHHAYHHVYRHHGYNHHWRYSRVERPEQQEQGFGWFGRSFMGGVRSLGHSIEHIAGSVEHIAGSVEHIAGSVEHIAHPAFAWCGWWMRQHVPGGDPGVRYNLARNWAHWGEPASGPAPGVIGVMPHHVFKVISVIGPGRVLAISGNDGHAVRTRVRGTGPVIAWRRP